MSTRYISVATRSDLKVIERYLYGASKVIFSTSKQHDDEGFAYDNGRTFAILETTSQTSASNALILAQSQADRLSSGLHGAKVHTTRQEAEDWLRETHDVVVPWCRARG